MGTEKVLLLLLYGPRLERAIGLAQYTPRGCARFHEILLGKLSRLNFLIFKM
jgi:hypothetical protein